MAEISDKLFKHLDREKERELMKSDFNAENIERALIRIAAIYSDYVFLYSKQQISFLTKRMNAKTRDKKLAQLKKLLNIAMDLGVSPEIYIKAQFEQQMGWLRKKGFTYVPFANLIADKAIERFKEYEARINSSYSSKEARRKEFYSTQTLDIEKSVADSMVKLYDRLVLIDSSVGELSKQIVVTELVVMAKAAQVSNIYVYCSPLSGVGMHDYLDKIFDEMSEKLNDFEKEMIGHTRSKVLESAKFSDEEIKKYI